MLNYRNLHFYTSKSDLNRLAHLSYIIPMMILFPPEFYFSLFSNSMYKIFQLFCRHWVVWRPCDVLPGFIVAYSLLVACLYKWPLWKVSWNQIPKRGEPCLLSFILLRGARMLFLILTKREAVKMAGYRPSSILLFFTFFYGPRHSRNL